jgi:hypothetical protein
MIRAHSIADLPDNEGSQTELDDAAIAALRAGDPISVDGVPHYPCANFTDCRKTVAHPKGKPGRRPTHCANCRRELDREQDTKLKRRTRARTASSVDVEPLPSPDPNHERWHGIYSSYEKLWGAHAAGWPFEAQRSLWFETLREQRHPRQSPYAGPRPCSHVVMGGSVIRGPAACNSAPAGTLLWNVDPCPTCAHLRGPEAPTKRLWDRVEREIERETGRPARPFEEIAAQRTFYDHAASNRRRGRGK